MVKTYTISKGNASLEKNIISLSYEEFIDASNKTSNGINY